MRDLPAHQDHQEKSEQHEAQRGQAVLDADDLVVGGKNVLAQEADVLVTAVVVVAVMVISLAERRKLVNGRFHNLFDHIWTAVTRHRFPRTRHVAPFQSADMSAHFP